MRSLSIIQTTMQLVNCIEAFQYYNCTENDLLIITSNYERHCQINKILDAYKKQISFHSIIEYNRTNKNGILYVLKLKWLLKKISSNRTYDLFFSTNYQTAQQKYLIKRLANKNSSLKIVIIDDGLSILDIVNRRNKELMTDKADIFYSSRAYKLLFKHALRKFHLPHIDYFTQYTGNINEMDCLLKNGYNFLKTHKINCLSETFPDDTVIILGQPLVGNPHLGINAFTKENYSKYIHDAISSLNLTKHSIFYYPHPAEDVDKSLTSSIKQQITIRKAECPFELIAVSLPKTCSIISFYSSTLINLRNTTQSFKLYSIYLNQINNCNNNQVKANVNSAYTYFRSIGIPVLFYNKPI